MIFVRTERLFSLTNISPLELRRSAVLFSMRKRKIKRREDVNQIAYSIMQAIANDEVPQTADGKNPFAVALGRKGGLIGGKARAASMTPQARSESARKAAMSRWKSKTNGEV